jgi:hypothetical protein
MKRCIILLACMVIGLAILPGCKSSVEKENIIDKTDSKQPVETNWEPTIYETVNNCDGVAMIKKEGTVSSDGLTVVFENNSDKQCTFGEYFLLEKKINQKWYQVPVIIDNYGFNMIGYNLAPGESRELEVKWEWLYGNLDAGEYRIVKDILDFREAGDFDEYYLTAEFTIE